MSHHYWEGWIHDDPYNRPGLTRQNLALQIMRRMNDFRRSGTYYILNEFNKHGKKHYYIIIERVIDDHYLESKVINLSPFKIKYFGYLRGRLRHMMKTGAYGELVFAYRNASPLVDKGNGHFIEVKTSWGFYVSKFSESIGVFHRDDNKIMITKDILAEFGPTCGVLIG